ncbi:MAG TPA: VOC family protein [Myxococcota bacterium]|jgi:catechol 2,3-dioxygenase-like lactoylglutathione lyase family enzyme
MLSALDHFVVAVRDLPAAARTYSRLLGRASTWRGEHPALGTENALFRLANTYVELLAPAEGAGRWLRDQIDARGEGLFALAFATPDADAFRAHAEAHGLRPGAVQPGLGRDSDSGAFRKWRNVMLDPSATHGAQLFAIEHLSPPDLLPLSPPTDENADATVDSVDHVVVQTADPGRAKALYGDALGIRLGLDRSFPQWGSRMLFFRLGHLTVEVVSQLADGAKAPDAPDRFWGVSYRVANAQAAHARLRDAGFELTPPKPGRKPGTFVFTVTGGTHGVATLVLQPSVSARGAG